MSISFITKRIGAANFSVGVTSVIQMGNAILSFVMVPLLLRYFTTEDYGLWVTLLSLVVWIGIFDFGIGFSFKNKVTEFLVDKDESKINKLFLQCFQYYIIISLIIFVIFLLLLNTVTVLSNNKLLSFLIYVPVILVFPLSIGSQILQGLRLTHISSLYGIAKSIIWAIFITILVFGGQESNILIAATVFSSINICFSTFMFYVALKKSKLKLPSLLELKTKPVFDDTIKTGLQFFVLQISSLLFFSMGNFYIYSNLSAKDTVDYDTINKIFTFYFSFFGTIISVYWSEIAYFKSLNDILKLKKIYKNLFLISLLFSLGGLILAFVAPIFIKYWTQGKVDITFLNCLPFAILITVQSVAYVGAVFMNAFEKVKPQIAASLVSMACLFPLMTYGFQQNWKIATPPIVAAVLVVPALFICHFYANRLIVSLKSIDIPSQNSNTDA